MTVKINSTADLWCTCYKSPYAMIEIPELEFEFSADGKRHTDSIYNHIGSAVYNLGG
jgi:C4-type Zn-finger protein